MSFPGSTLATSVTYEPRELPTDREPRRREAIAYLTRCADDTGQHWYSGYRVDADDCPTCHGTNDAGHLRCFSRYGSRSDECAPVAWRLAYLLSRETGEPITAESLQHCMGMVVNEHDDVAYTIRNYGRRKYT